MVTPLVHMGLGYDDLLVPALVHAGFETKDLVLVVRTDANLSWVRKHAPRATTVRLPYAAARKANVVSGLAPHAALKRACAGVGKSGEQTALSLSFAAIPPRAVTRCRRVARPLVTIWLPNILTHECTENASEKCP